MNYLDIVIAIILILFCIKGFRKGLINEVVSLLAFVLGIYGAMCFSDFTAARLVEFIDINPRYINTVAFILTFIILVILVNLLGNLVTKIVKSLKLGLANRIGGILFGGLKGILLCSLLMMVLNNLQLLGFVKPEIKEQSLLYPFVEKTVPYVYQGFDFVKGTFQDLAPANEENAMEQVEEAEGQPDTTPA